jgi:hypothetical protein
MQKVGTCQRGFLQIGLIDWNGWWEIHAACPPERQRHELEAILRGKLSIIYEFNSQKLNHLKNPEGVILL